MSSTSIYLPYRKAHDKCFQRADNWGTLEGFFMSYYGLASEVFLKCLQNYCRFVKSAWDWGLLEALFKPFWWIGSISASKVCRKIELPQVLNFITHVHEITLGQSKHTKFSDFSLPGNSVCLNSKFQHLLTMSGQTERCLLVALQHPFEWDKIMLMKSLLDSPMVSNFHFLMSAWLEIAVCPFF